jgi:hypothetical protein
VKSIILRVGSGNLTQGFPGVYVELKGDGINGWGESTSLLPDPDLKTKYDAWERVYRASVRLSERGTTFHTPTGTQIGLASIHQVTSDLIAALNHWLIQGDFARIQAQLRTDLDPDDRISLSIITTDDTFLWKLPWHHWDFCKAYAHCVESFSKSHIQANLQQKLRANGRVDILAIWGHAPELELAKDLAALQQPRARVTHCQPKSAIDISDTLIEQQQIRILFFGGHGETIELELEANTQSIGTIYLDKDTPISISKIKTDLKQAIERGLQIAIFNCCSGLGLAQELADLNLPYLVVMRSQIPDKLAQQFCQDLLSRYSQGGDFTTAFDYARGRLVTRTDRDDEFESWLPMLVHNPQSNRVTWADLSRAWWQLPAPQPLLKARRQLNKPDRLPLTWVGISLLSTALTIGLQALTPIEQLESLAIDRLQFTQAMMRSEPSHVVVLNINQPIDNDAIGMVIKDPETGRYIINEADLQDLTAIPFAALGLDVQLEDRRSENSWLEDRQRNITINCDKRSPMMSYSSEQTCPALAWSVTKNYASVNRWRSLSYGESVGIKTPIILNPYLTPKILVKQLNDITKVNQTNPAFFKDKILLVGYVENLSSSVMIHATAAESIASGQGLLTSYTDSIGNIYLLFWAGIGASSIFYRRRLWPLAIGITGGCVVTGSALFVSGSLLPLVPAAIVVVVSVYLVYLIKCPNESIDT